MASRSIPVPDRFARKLKKLRSDPGAFVYDLIAKRTGKPTRAQLGLTDVDTGSGLLGHALARGESHLGDALLAGIEQLQSVGFFAGEQSGTEPLLLAYYPAAFVNPFQQLLYRDAAERGFFAVPLSSLEELAEIRWPGRLLCHLHWVGGVLHNADDEGAARRRIATFLARIDRLKDRGTRIVWTVHNVLPHHTRYRALEVELREALLERADAVHSMTRLSYEETATHYELPRQKMFHSPHPSYASAYPDFVSRQQARFLLGVRPAETALVFFGSLQSYKGVRELLEAFTALPFELATQARLIVAGVPSDREYAAALNADFGHADRVAIHARSVQTVDVQTYLRAADYVVCPYRASLNSGVAVLAHDFDAPIIAPQTGAMGELISEGGGIGYELGSHESLCAALAEALSTPRSDFLSEIAIGRERRVNASLEFFDGLRETLG